jgi:MFS family permease
MLLNEIPQSTIGLIMLAAVLGGLAFQVPAGWASDRYDRRLVLGVVAAGFACAAMALVFLPRSLSLVLPVAAIMGGFMSTLYPVSVAHAMDNITGKNVIANSSGIILLNGLGSIFGPFVGSWLMGRFDINALLYFMAAAAGILGAAALSQTSRNRVPSPQHPLPALSPQGVQIAPLQGKE